ncbi:MAG TPA: GFA family protein [Polyangiales bacterium]|nr:GFA family protein [Polyangiales bacterium]
MLRDGVNMLTGSCLCGGVRYEAEGPATAIARCHCVQCRKASGAEFATNASVPAESFRVVAGAELIGAFEWKPGQARHFCRGCGSPLFKRNVAAPEVVRVRLGTLDDASDLVRGPECHVFVSERPAWSEICDDLPQFERLPVQP